MLSCRTLVCKVEEIHTTLTKHLAKEEEQLLPLLLQHFTASEQAELVAQFLYSIPLETVERVLGQLKPRIPRVRDHPFMASTSTAYKHLHSTQALMLANQ